MDYLPISLQNALIPFREMEPTKLLCPKVALAAAPVLNKNISLCQRCELALTGYLALDVFHMLSERRCLAMGLPKGSCGMAGQTRTNLQACCLSIISLALSKDKTFNPFTFGFGRIAELGIEHHFASLRKQSPNSQLSARGFWAADCRQALRANKVAMQEKPPGAGDGALSHEQFLGQGWFFFFNNVVVVVVAVGCNSTECGRF